MSNDFSSVFSVTLISTTISIALKTSFKKSSAEISFPAGAAFFTGSAFTSALAGSSTFTGSSFLISFFTSVFTGSTTGSSFVVVTSISSSVRALALITAFFAPNPKNPALPFSMTSYSKCSLVVASFIAASKTASSTVFALT